MWLLKLQEQNDDELALKIENMQGCAKLSGM